MVNHIHDTIWSIKDNSNTRLVNTTTPCQTTVHTYIVHVCILYHILMYYYLSIVYLPRTTAESESSKAEEKSHGLQQAKDQRTTTLWLSR